MERINFAGILSPCMALICAPALMGVIAKTKAFFAGRKGPPFLQTYYDIAKLLRKGAVYSTTTSWVFKAGPVVCVGAAGAACFFIPFGTLGAPISFTGDVVLFMYLLGVMRFFTVIAALDTGSAFEGMGASREVFFSALAEPVFLLCILSLARSTQGFRLNELFSAAPPFHMAPALLAGASLFVILLAENARIPVDDPATHLELTMIHEVMVLDHSGPDFGFITYGSCLKLWLFALVFVRMLLPFHATAPGVDVLLTALGMGITGVCVGTVESVMARLRLLRVPQLLAGAAALAVLALLSGEGAIL